MLMLMNGRVEIFGLSSSADLFYMIRNDNSSRLFWISLRAEPSQRGSSKCCYTRP
jgi:hypothetical protein